MDIQRLRNLTTGKLHTDICYVYEDLELITGEKGLMTHMLPRAAEAITPWLKKNVTDVRFWDGEYDTTHTGDYVLPDPTDEERKEMFNLYAAMPNPFHKKEVE